MSRSHDKLLFLSNEAIYLTKEGLKDAELRTPWYNLRQIIVEEYDNAIHFVCYKSNYKEDYIKKDNENLKGMCVEYILIKIVLKFFFILIFFF
jgi:hypothetical protein